MKVKSKKILIFTSVLSVCFIFFIYNNLDLSKEIRRVYFDSITIKNETIKYGAYILEGADPIFLDANQSKVVLLLHGMGGTPIELKELGDYLYKNNISVFIPLLKNQGRTYNDLKGLNREDLYNEALFYSDILNKNYQDVYIGGLSTGGSISLKLAET